MDRIAKNIQAKSTEELQSMFENHSDWSQDALEIAKTELQARGESENYLIETDEQFKNGLIGKKNNNILITMVSIVAAVFGGIIAKDMVGEKPIWGNQSSVGNLLQNAASELNAKLPMKVDDETYLISARSSQQVFIYTYSVPKISKDDINIPHFETKMRSILLNEYKSNPSMKSFRDHNVKLVYRYNDKDGLQFAEIFISTDDF